MKQILTSILLLSFVLHTAGQENNEDLFLQVKSKTDLFYVKLKKKDAVVYEMGIHWDKAGRGYSIRNSFALTRQADGSYRGQDIKITKDNNVFYLVTELRKTKKYHLEAVNNPGTANNNLNNAYYLDGYFEMSGELNKAYSLYHHSFRNGFHTWEAVPNKETEHVQFREFTDKRIKEMKDSICQVQDSNLSLTKYIIQHIETLEYSTLKDNLRKLPTDAGLYYGTVINKIAKHTPGYFFRLAEEFPANRGLIFTSVEDNKEIVRGLKKVKGHDEIKKVFFKDKRLGKTMPYRIIGTYAIVIGLVTLLTTIR